MSQAALSRKLRNVGYGGLGACAPQPFPFTRQAIEERQDEQRTFLAAELLKIALENASPYDFKDSHEIVVLESHSQVGSLTVEQWLVKLAGASLAAAAVVYLELPAEERTGGQQVATPSAVLEGAQSVTGVLERPLYETTATKPRAGVNP